MYMNDYPEHSDDLYEVELNRWFNVQCIKLGGILSCVLLILAVMALAVYTENNRYFVFSILALVVLPFMFITKILSNPRYIDVTKDYIKIKYDYTGYSFFRRLVKDRPDDFESDVRNYIVTKIEYLHFEQTSFEKKFNSGHLIVCGTAYLSTNALDDKGENKIFTIYGLKQYNETRAWLEEHVNTMEKARKEIKH